LAKDVAEWRIAWPIDDPDRQRIAGLNEPLTGQTIIRVLGLRAATKDLVQLDIISRGIYTSRVLGFIPFFEGGIYTLC